MLGQIMARSDVILACDMMIGLEGSIQPALYLAEELIARGHKVSIISPLMSNDVERRLIEDDITPVNLHAKLLLGNVGHSWSWFETWAQEAFLRLRSKRLSKITATVNFSQVISMPSRVWYLQGPPTIALRDMEKELSIAFRLGYNAVKPFIERADEGLINRMRRGSGMIIGNSRFCASMYSKYGIEASDVIYPPIDCQTFRPSPSSNSSDYVLTYFGKETKFSVVKRVADEGVKIKAFGSKVSLVQKNLIEHPNVEFLGRISTSTLVEAYSNALFTLFPFTHEPFGYVPLESMACGTPVLTYNMQGPSEYVTNERTGWLIETDEEAAKKAVSLWNNGYPAHMNARCVEEAARFDKKNYVEKWLRLLKDSYR
jgi:glycosyltransferase involved in cell wall biosynthesis